MCVYVGVVYVDIVCNWPRVASYALVRDFKSASKTALSLRTYYIDVLSRTYVCVCGQMSCVTFSSCSRREFVIFCSFSFISWSKWLCFQQELMNMRCHVGSDFNLPRFHHCLWCWKHWMQQIYARSWYFVWKERWMKREKKIRCPSPLSCLSQKKKRPRVSPHIRP